MARNKKNSRSFAAFVILAAVLVLLAGCTSSRDGNAPATDKKNEGTIISISDAFSSEVSANEGELIGITAEVENTGSVPLENVNAIFYNFGSNLFGCPDVYIGELPPGESYEAKCDVTAKTRDSWGDPEKTSFTQEISLKVRYSFPISGAFESIRVMSPEEYARVNPGSKTEEKSVAIGPVTMKAEFQKQPAVSGRDFPISLSFAARTSSTEGIETFEDMGTVASAQLRVPASFSFSGKGSFDSAGIPCGDGKYVCATKSGWTISGKNSSTLLVNVRPPSLSVPEETFSARFDAEGFTVFRIAKKKITVSAVSSGE
ncbi:MAG: hypothetical protein V1820_01260 [archaeon]